MLEDNKEKVSIDMGDRSRRRPSFFGPIVLIGIGVWFLLANLGLAPDLNWNWLALLQLWPLWLILLGLNLIVRQLPGVVGGFMSAMVGVVALVVFGYILLASEDNVILNRFDWATSAEVQRQSISYAASDADRADIDLNFSAAAVELFALEDSGDLINGTVSYSGELIFDHSVQSGRAVVSLDTRQSSDGPFNFFSIPWAELGGEDNRWRLGLSPQLPLDLTLDGGSGRLDLNLSQLKLQELRLDAGSGRIDLALPGGDFETTIDVGSGSLTVTCGKSGRQNIQVHAGSGSMTFHLPDALEARVEIDSGSGGVHLDLDRFHQVSGDKDEGIWETANYDDSPDRVDLRIDLGSGSLTVGR